MENRIFQLERCTREELLADFEKVINKLIPPHSPSLSHSHSVSPSLSHSHSVSHSLSHSPSPSPSLITILSPKQAASALGISYTFFNKLRSRGIITPTVDAGINRNGRPRQMYALHHLMAIRGIVQRLKYMQDDDKIIEAKNTIKQILGL